MPLRESLAAGLEAMGTRKPGSGYAEIGGGVTNTRGPFAYAEAGVRLTPSVRLFARGEADTKQQGVVGGLRWDFF